MYILHDRIDGMHLHALLHPIDCAKLLASETALLSQLERLVFAATALLGVVRYC